jgi:protein-arginine kinase activator protein McsA
MKCARCGAEVTNKIIKINGVIYCENCVKELGYDRFLKNPEELLGAAFSPLDEIASSFAKMAELDFGNSALTCPKCGMSLREFENKGIVGCIECYNTFGDYVTKEMFRQQGADEYAGRAPGQSLIAEDSLIGEDDSAEENKDTSKAEAKDDGAKKEKAEDKAADPAGDEKKLEKLSKADIGMLTDEELTEGIKLATKLENYQLAIRFRDELKGRKDGE